MSSVTFSTTVGGDGSTVTDDDNATTGLGNGGALIRLVPMMQQVVNVAETTVAAATSSLGGATTNSTSTTSLSIATGSKSLTLVESGKAYTIGQYVIIASTASPTNYMVGQVTSFSGTSLVVNVTVINGSGTIAAWSISVTAVANYLPLAGGTMTGSITFSAGQKFLNWTIKTTTYNPAVAGDNILADTFGGAFTITLPASAVLSDTINIADYKGTFATNNLTINSNGLNLMGSVQTLILNVNYRNVTLVYSGATQGWVIVL